jgi:hypothetical protein
VSARRAVATSGWLVLIGALASGPLGIWIVQATHPQPPWRDAATFVAAYHRVQTVPYLLGFLLIGGFVGLVASLHVLAPRTLASRTTTALPLVGAFAAMILLNYTLQTTVVPALAAADVSDWSDVISGLTMSNPRSLGWALEMWGYAVLGVATLLVAPVFSGSTLESVTRSLFTANAPVSVAGGFATALWPGWVMTAVGFVAFGLWNLLVVAMAACAILTMRRRSRIEAPAR